MHSKSRNQIRFFLPSLTVQWNQTFSNTSNIHISSRPHATNTENRFYEEGCANTCNSLLSTLGALRAMDLRLFLSGTSECDGIHAAYTLYLAPRHKGVFLHWRGSIYLDPRT